MTIQTSVETTQAPLSAQETEHLRHLSRALVRELGLLQKTVCGSDLSMSAAHALIEIGHPSNAASNAKQLATRLCLDKTTVSRLCSGLRTKGYVVEHTDPVDRRSKRLTLTDQGQAVLDGINTVSVTRIHRALDPLSEEDRAQILSGLGLYARALHHVRDDTLDCPPLSVPTAPYQIVIRPWDPADQQAVIDLILPIQQQEFAVPITLADQPDLLTVPDVYGRGRGCFLVAASPDGDIVGTIALIDSGVKDMAILRKMFVRADHRGPPAFGGQKLADRLMDAALAHARTEGLRRIVLGTTGVMEAAQRFYHRRDFSPLDVDALPDGFPRMSCDTVFFELRL